MQQKYGIIDLGSNSCRLVIYERLDSGSFKEIENVKVVARLRKYADKNNYITQEGIDILITTLQNFQEITRLHKVEQIICAATATIRQAKNQREICKLVRKKTDFTIQVISEQQEAQYGYEAIINATPFTEGITVDMGGGSTEVTYVKNRQLIHYHSFPFGSLSLKQQFMKGNFPTEEERKAISSYVRKQFATLDWLKSCRLPIIAIGGSARSIVRSHQLMISYQMAGEHLYKMKLDDMKNVQKMLTSFSYEEVQKFDGVGRERADTILAALEAFVELGNMTEMKAFYLSRKGLRDGLLFRHFQSRGATIPTPMEVRDESVLRAGLEYQSVGSSFNHKLDVSYQIYKQLHKLGVIQFEDNNFLYYGLILYNVGKYVDLESSAQHSFYLVANKNVDGFVHKERLMLALLSSYQSRGKCNSYMEEFPNWFTKEEQQKIHILGSVIKLVNSLHITTRSIVESVRLVAEGNSLIFFIVCNSSYLIEKAQVERQKKHLERAIEKNIRVYFVEEGLGESGRSKR